MLILVPTRELVVQVVEEIEKFVLYTNVRVTGVYGGTNINTQKQAVAQGLDIVVATPRETLRFGTMQSITTKIHTKTGY